jgi:hypothetical protein
MQKRQPAAIIRQTPDAQLFCSSTQPLCFYDQECVACSSRVHALPVIPRRLAFPTNSGSDLLQVLLLVTDLKS